MNKKIRFIFNSALLQDAMVDILKHQLVPMFAMLVLTLQVLQTHAHTVLGDNSVK
jgi:hypothetical protein